MTEDTQKEPRIILTHQPAEEEDTHDMSRETIRSATPTIPSAAQDSSRNNLREASTPVVGPSQGPEKLVPRTPALVEEREGEPANGSFVPKPHYVFSRERRQARSVRMADRESSRYRQGNKTWAVVVGDFQGIYGDELTLKAGEKVEIVSKDVRVSRNIGWWTGRNERGKYGIFPEGCVKVLTKKDGDREASVEVEYPFIISCSDIELKEAIGVGGFGRVHRAIYKQEEVAVKVAKSTTFDLVKAAQEVITEAKKFAHLAHVNVCALIGVVLVKDVCLVMEYAQGGAISEVIHKKKLSLPLDVILDWAQQIASGMNYLHHEAVPSLIHRDLKSSNILLAYPVTPSNLHNNVIKITDFGLAREIEHTTQMSGAGTYPWMAPEVIISNDFSKKCDVWSYGVVLWELLTGEKPYGSLNVFVVAYGVGRGTLSLPIPEGCPESFQNLMKACWRKAHSERPSFPNILWMLKDIEREEFMTSTSVDDFFSIQSTWKSEIKEKFLQFKREEIAFHDQELPGDITKRIKQQEEKIRQQQEELNRLRMETREAQEAWQRQRQLEQEEQFKKQREELEKLREKLKEMETRGSEEVAEQQSRPPRVKRVSWKRLLRWLSGTDHQKDQGRRPSSETSSKGDSSKYVGKTSPPPYPPRRTTSFPSTSDPRGPACYATEPSPIEVVVEKRTSLPGRQHPQKFGHKRRHSGGNISKSQVELLDTYGPRRPSSPAPPSSSKLGPQVRPFMEEMQKLINQDDSTPRRLRSVSNPRSPSPNLLPHVSSPRSPKSPSAQASSTSSAAHSQSASVANDFGPIRTPSNLMLNNKHVCSDDSNPNSPMNTVYDSGKDSNTGSDFSSHSVTSDPQRQMHHLMSFDSPTSPKAFDLSYFDPLHQGPTRGAVHQTPTLRQTPSFDSLLMDPKGGTTSGNVSPNLFSTSPSLRRQTSPKTSLTVEQQQHIARQSPIARPRPRPGKLPSYTSDASISRPFSPKREHRRRSDVSPSGSVQSLTIPSVAGYESDYGCGLSGFQSDSDATSTHSSLLDVSREECDDPHPTLMPTPASLETIHFNFDIKF